MKITTRNGIVLDVAASFLTCHSSVAGANRQVGKLAATKQGTCKVKDATLVAALKIKIVKLDDKVLHVQNETQRVGPGDCVFIPSGQPHGLKNDGKTTLRYFSSAALAYPAGHWEETWTLKSEAEE